MTIYVSEEEGNMVQFAVNVPNLTLGFDYGIIITSQYSHAPLGLDTECTFSNSRYSLFEVVFPAGFGEEHKNGIYYWDLVELGQESLEKGLVKIITQPGGNINAISYNSGVITENRVSTVFYRPNY